MKPGYREAFALAPRLYFKLLAWFVATLCAILLTQFVLAIWRQPQHASEFWRKSDDPQTSYAERGARVLGPLLDSGKQSAVENYLAALKSGLGIESFVFTGQVRPGDAQNATPRVLELAHAATRQPRLIEVRENGGEWRYTTQKFRSPEGREFTLVMRFQPDLNLSDSRSYTLMLLVVGLFCVGLARYIVSPAQKLRRATQRFAAGDLSVRVAPEMGRRRDELADLGRDFDAMAARIESLLQNERRLLADISHELRSPLARQSAALELLRDVAPPEIAPHLKRIERENERLDDLIGQLLALTRLESGQFPLHREPFDFAELAREIAEDLHFEGDAAGIAVTAILPAKAAIMGDRELLRRAVENVGRNALRHTSPGEGVRLKLEQRDELWCLVVRDFGEGVPPELLDQIFQPFFRVHDARDRQSGGAGLGLAITQRAVALHGGTIAARCPDGGGLEIEMCLPRVQA